MANLLITSFPRSVQICAFPYVLFSDSLSKRSLCQPSACLLLTHYSQHPKYPPRGANPSVGTNLSQENVFFFFLPQENVLRGLDHQVLTLVIQMVTALSLGTWLSFHCVLLEMIHFITTESFSKGCNSIWVAKHSECFIMDNGPNTLAYVSNQKKRKDTKAAVDCAVSTPILSLPLPCAGPTGQGL